MANERDVTTRTVYGRRVEDDEDESTSDTTATPEATREELREAAERAPGLPTGQRGDLGDSPPGED